MDVLGYTESGSIRAEIDGVEMFVPDDMSNRHRQLVAEWEAAGNTIPAYEPPEADLIAYAAQKRWEKEVGGIEIGGKSVHTDDRSKSLIMGARLAAETDPNFSTDWKAADGSFLAVDAPTIIMISSAVLGHVAACFGVEAQVMAAIESGTITTVAEIDAAFM